MRQRLVCAADQLDDDQLACLAQQDKFAPSENEGSIAQITCAPPFVSGGPIETGQVRVVEPEEEIPPKDCTVDQRLKVFVSPEFSGMIQPDVKQRTADSVAGGQEHLPILNDRVNAVSFWPSPAWPVSASAGGQMPAVTRKTTVGTGAI